MGLHISDRALAKWAANDLTVEPQSGGSLVFRFSYEASSCRDGGQPFASRIVGVLRREDGAGWRIEEVRVELDPDDPGWRATCIHESNLDPDPAKLTADSPAQGMLLDEFLARDWPTDKAGCFCTSVHVTHKLLLALSTVRYWLERRPRKHEAA